MNPVEDEAELMPARPLSIDLNLMAARSAGHSIGMKRDMSMTAERARLALARADLLREQAFIDGQWCDGPEVIDVHNPASGALLGTVPQLREEATTRAIAAAQGAFDGWRSRSARERATILRRWYELIVDNAEDLARLMTAEQGKPLNEARGEIAYAASFVEWFSEEARRAYGDVIPGHEQDKRLIVLKQPVGVVAAITPWNFPASDVRQSSSPPS